MTSLQNLKDKSFVKVNDEGELVMDYLLCDMGQQIVRNFGL
jgi:hypothetical protein